ncbi:hypothetical protein HIM_02737 [Hirsutella minnesotensis 3608]|nr:hypothetical protein HIM_02737 [Hirsutella minnesotensis 3608]
MAEGNPGESPKADTPRLEANEDAEMRAARRELKQSSISDPPPTTLDSPRESAIEDKAEACAATPADEISDAQNEDLKSKILSPKKKRAHDQLDGDKKSKDNDTNSVESTDSAKDRASRLEPEKKRHRDEDSNGAKPPDNPEPQLDARAKDENSGSESTKTPETSTSAFAASGFGKLAQGSSAFAVLGAAPGSGFASATKSGPALSSGSQLASQPASAAQAPKLTFGGNGGVSPFAGLSSGSNGFSSKLSGGFASAFPTSKSLTSFGATAGKPLQSGKADRPFGAPESDSEPEEDDADEQGEAETPAEDAQRGVSPERELDDKRRTKLHRVEVDDGEAGEVTVVSVRAKMFSLDKEAGWKERGAGMLKVNVPRSCVDFDDAGAPVSGSFDASGLEADEESGKDPKGHKVARLILRQDQTHRVILNTVIMPAMLFQEKTSLKSVGILFTAFEGEDAKPVSVTMKARLPDIPIHSSLGTL